MTTVVSLKGVGGIVLASDSQYSTSFTKEMGSKIFQVNKNTGLGCAGIVGQFGDLLQALKIKLTDELTDQELRSSIEDAILDLHKKYNVGWSKFLGYAGTVNHFYPEAIVCAKLKDGFGLFSISFSNGSFWVTPVENTATIGSGAVFANLILKQQSRPLVINDKSYSGADLAYSIWVACLTVNECKAYDIASGGETEIVIVDSSGFRKLTSEEISKYYHTFIDILYENLYKKMGVPKEKVKELYPIL